MYKIRTIDIWDTLLRRDCHPECIKLATCRHLLLTRLDQLQPALQDQWLLYQVRINTERLLAEESRVGGGDDEYEITNVLSHWLVAVLVGGFDPTLPKVLAEYELSVEMKRSYPDPGVVDFLLDYQAERSVFLSDFYMDAEVLGRLLEAKGLKHLVSEGFSSCDVGLNKRSGGLFNHIHEKYEVAPEKHVHIGDNLWSDVESAERFGIKAIHYLPDAEHELRLKREHLFSSRNVLFKHVRDLCLSEAELFTLDHNKTNSAFLLGVEAAPLFIGFAMWIAEQSLKHGLDCIFFLTREGEFFHQVYSKIFPENHHAGHTLPPSQVLPVSRLSTFVASLGEPTFVEVSRAWSLFNQQSISALFLTLNLDIAEFSETLDRLGLGANDVINNPSESRQLEELFNEVEFRDALTRSIKRQKSLLHDLLCQSIPQKGKRVGVVDIGWRGTIQDNLALVMPHAHFHGMYLGLRAFVNTQPANVTKEAYGPNESVSDELNALFEVFAALEMLCSSPNGCVSGYQRNGEKISPKRDISTEENIAFFRFTSHFQRGVLFATERWRPMLDAYVVSAHELREQGLKVWDGLRVSPPESLALIFMQTPQHDVFGFGDLFARSQVPSLTTVALSPFMKTKRRNLIEFVRRVQWAAAIDKMQGISWFHRKVLLIIFRIANEIKLLRMRATHKRRHA